MNTDKSAEEVVKALRNAPNYNAGIGTSTIENEAAAMLESRQSRITSLEQQLAAAQRRERAAVADLEYACGSSGEFELRSICDICRRKQTDGTCPTQCEMNSLAASNKWEWRGVEGKESK